MKNFIWIFIIIIFILIITVYFSHRHFTVVFTDIRPFDKNISVYYKGILVGKTSSQSHSKDFLRTNVKITLYNKKIKLPLNTVAVLKKKIKNDYETDYIDLIYPNIASERFITENSHIHGISMVDIKEYLKNQNPEDLEKIKSNLLTSFENLSSSLEAIGGMFILIQDILQENRENLKSSSYNLQETSKNINKMSKKLDNIIIEEQWNNTFKNIENSTGGLHDFTSEINNTITNLNNSIPETLQNTNEITNNLSIITCGIRNTLSKKFGGLRLFFGKIIE